MCAEASESKTGSIRGGDSSLQVQVKRDVTFVASDEVLGDVVR